MVGIDNNIVKYVTTCRMFILCMTETDYTYSIIRVVIMIIGSFQIRCFRDTIVIVIL